LQENLADALLARRLVNRQIKLTIVLAVIGSLTLIIGAQINEKLLIAIGAIIIVFSPYISVYIVARKRRLQGNTTSAV
jgi:hypothetical protein